MHAETLEALRARWARYHADKIDTTIAPNDDMFIAEGGGLEHYLFVGISALEVISEAMLLARRAQFARVLDMPCGCGRVTRHLVKFFPDATILVSEIDKAKQTFAASQFGAQAIDIPADFSGDPRHQCDLIFVGSLFTHLNAAQTTRALGYLLDMLSEDGILLFTTHGRYAMTQTPKGRYRSLERRLWRGFMRRGFGYQGDNRYGTSVMAPSWVLAVLETFANARVLGHRELGWARHQDVFIVQKATGWTVSRPGNWWWR
jgi:SAM-dependent methyltransferase